MFALNPQTQKIGIFSPSSYIDQARFTAGLDIIKSYGFDVNVHEQSFLTHAQSAGTHQDKINALYELNEDSSIGMIMAAGGGNRSIHLLDQINYNRLNSEIIFCGYSDSTALLNAFAHKSSGFQGVYGPMVQNLSAMGDKDLDYFFKLIKGTTSTYCFTDETRVLNHGRVQGRLIGGTLSLLQSLTGTPYMADTEGCILYIEDCYEELSRIDRMFQHLKFALPFDSLGGIIIGSLSNLQDTGRPFGFSIDDIIHEYVSGFNGPVVKTASFGHGKHMRALPFNIEAKFTADKNKVELNFI